MHIWQQIYLYQPEKIGIWQHSLQWTELPHIATNICQAKDVAAADASGCLGKPNIPLTLSPSIPANKITINQWSQIKVWWQKSLESDYLHTKMKMTTKRMSTKMKKNLSIAYNLVRLVSLSASNPLIGRRITDSPHLSCCVKQVAPSWIKSLVFLQSLTCCLFNQRLTASHHLFCCTASCKKV